MGEFVKLGPVDEVPVGQMRSYDLKGQSVLVANTEAGLFALADECSHDMAPISEGELNGTEIICPRHHARFDVRNGDVKAPPAVVPIDTFPLKVEDGDIYVELED